MQITVFCYHNAIAPGLARDLVFLADNGYRTLTASEVVDALTGATPVPDKAVALTFDDGLLSLRTVGLPLLEQYDARATIFAITGLTPEGRTEPQGTGDLYRLLGWDDLRVLRDSGRVEIGSHGQRHNPVHVPTSAEAGPAIRVRDYKRLYDVPVPYRQACDADSIRAADGTPGHPSRPLFATETVLTDGEPSPSGPAILADLEASRELLAVRLGVDRFHLCLPYGAGTETMPELARRAGFESLFWTRRSDRDTNGADDPYRIVRRKHDFLRRLPGRGRRSVLDVFVTKVRRRLTSDAWE